MPFSFNAKYALAAIIPIGIAITTIAWQHAGSNPANENQQKQDTVLPKHRHSELRDDEMQDGHDLDRAMRKLDEALKNAEVKIDRIDWDQIQQQVNTSLDKANQEIRAHVDMGNIQRQVDQALRNMDMEKIQRETNRALQQATKNIDFNEINDEIKRAMNSVKVELNSEGIRKSIRDVEKAHWELDDYRDLLDALKNDGLINKDGDFTIEYKQGELFINDQKQPKGTTNRYKKYFNQENTRISKNNGRFNVDTD